MKNAVIVQTEEQLLFQIEDGGAVPTSPLQMQIRMINNLTAKNAYKKWHYLKDQDFIGMYNFGAYYDGLLGGAISFGPPSAEETIQGLFGHKDQNGYFEIKRLAMNDNWPKNSESRFISVSLKLLNKMTEVKGIITYADTSVGHTGTIYKATGFKYKGLTSPKKDYWVMGKIQQRGKIRGNGEWRERSQKHLFYKLINSREKEVKSQSYDRSEVIK